jgi:UDP-N-acetylglucosamine diphosphorylase / glucose-1-phosphate thymidylyltransferase / UDP-N-acetylgalactosamine diphosphorylase / glucosamine-1-phosphate N-acetyltransferase / galactosamine-1-phosphate N-acetyltransferase
MIIILFEDELAAQLDPVGLGKPAFAITSGGYRLIDLAQMCQVPVRAIVRPHLAAFLADYQVSAPAGSDLAGGALALNARLVPSMDVLKRLQEMLKRNQPGVAVTGEAVAAAVVPAAAFASGMTVDFSNAGLRQLGLPTLVAELPVFDYAHDIVRYHLLSVRESLEHRARHGEFQQHADGVFCADGATLGQYVVTDTRNGPIVLERGAIVGPYSLLNGPLYLGAGSRVLEHAALKDGVVIGHTAKIGGEVEAAIIEPYTNKQHHGFLGHSYLGSWVNLGAGTCNSDLKNTYGQVNMEYRGRKIATGMQFIGAIIGDYAKTAINTGVFTGKTIGVCSMVYGFVTTNVPSFVNYARLFGQVTEAPVEVMASTQRRMFARRGVEQRPCDIQLLQDMHQLTAWERQQPGEPLSLEPLSL